MRRHRFETYLDKLFDWTASVATMAEGRHNSPHPWPKVFDAVFLGSACQFGPVHRIEAECKDGVLNKRIGPLSEETSATLFNASPRKRCLISVAGSPGN